MFSPDLDLANLTTQVSYMFHVTIGLDLLGGFSAVEGLSYEMDAYEYKELGRNHSPVMLPFDGPGKPGELTLRWGIIVRSKLFNWMNDVRQGGDFRKDIYIFQLSQMKLPFRVYHLTGCWPKRWESSNFSTEQAAELSTEQLTLVYDQLDMLNLSAVAMAGDLLAGPVSDLLGLNRPKAYRPTAGGSDSRGVGVKYVGGKPVGPVETGGDAVGADTLEENEARERSGERVLEENLEGAEGKDTLEQENEDGSRDAQGEDTLETTSETSRYEAAAGSTELEGVETDYKAVGSAVGETEEEGTDVDYKAVGAAVGESKEEGTDVDYEAVGAAVGKESEEQANEDGDRDAVPAEEGEAETDDSEGDTRPADDEEEQS